MWSNSEISRHDCSSDVMNLKNIFSWNNKQLYNLQKLNVNEGNCFVYWGTKTKKKKKCCWFLILLGSGVPTIWEKKSDEEHGSSKSLWAESCLSVNILNCCCSTSFCLSSQSGWPWTPHGGAAWTWTWQNANGPNLVRPASPSLSSILLPQSASYLKQHCKSRNH